MLPALASRTCATGRREARENERKAVKPDARYDDGDLVADLERRFGDGAVARGHDVFAANCARCHSSLPEASAGSFMSRDFRALDPETGLRADWLGHDAAPFASEIGPNRCRSLTSNPLAGHTRPQFGPEPDRKTDC